MDTQHTKLKTPTVLVLGGYGFIGRHIVEALKHLEVNVLIGTRKLPIRACERQTSLHRLAKCPKIGSKLLTGVDVVINAVGILRQRWGENYQDVHHLALAELANVCATENTRLIHVSALGLNNPVGSRFLKSKLDGEHALVNSKADWFLVRPSLVDGDGGFGARWFKRVAKWPIHFVPSNARGLIMPINANELGQAIAKIALLPKTTRAEASRIYQLGGEQVLNLPAYLNDLRQRSAKSEYTKPAYIANVPALVARLLSHLCDALYLTPFSFGHYELLKFDNVAHPNRLQELLNNKLPNNGRPPTPIVAPYTKRITKETDTA